jgi:hypothetical protein
VRVRKCGGGAAATESLLIAVQLGAAYLARERSP